jgi:hypothetical protein
VVFVVQQDISRPARVISSDRVISRPARVISSDRVISRPARVISSDRVISRPARVISSDRVISSRAQVISRGRDVSSRPESLCSRVILSPLRMTRSAQDDSVRYESSHVARHCKAVWPVRAARQRARRRGRAPPRGSCSTMRMHGCRETERERDAREGKAGAWCGGGGGDSVWRTRTACARLGYTL